MAAASKLDRLKNGPGLFEITFGALLSVILGVALAFFHLIFKPVEQVKGPPEQAVAGVVYYQAGSDDPSKSRQWMRKRQMLVEGGSAEIAFTEDELNAWLSTAANGASPAKEEATFSFVPGSLNVRMEQSTLQLGVPGQVSVVGEKLPLIIQARGKMESSAAGYVFAPDELFIGSLATHRVPGLKEFLVQRMIASQSLPDEVTAAWRKITRVAVENGTLRLSLP